MTHASFAMDILHIFTRIVHPVYFSVFEFPIDTSIHSVPVMSSNHQIILSSSDRS